MLRTPPMAIARLLATRVADDGHHSACFDGHHQARSATLGHPRMLTRRQDRRRAGPALSL
jgi:hypothetical protein